MRLESPFTDPMATANPIERPTMASQRTRYSQRARPTLTQWPTVNPDPSRSNNARQTLTRYSQKKVNPRPTPQEQ